MPLAATGIARAPTPRGFLSLRSMVLTSPRATGLVVRDAVEFGIEIRQFHRSNTSATPWDGDQIWAERPEKPLLVVQGCPTGPRVRMATNPLHAFGLPLIGGFIVKMWRDADDPLGDIFAEQVGQLRQRASAAP